MTGLLDGKAILISGAARGIGRASALLFAREGARVAVADLSAEGAAETVALINVAGGQAIAVVADVSKAADADAMVARTCDAFGRIDGAFNNAGVAAYQVGAAGARTADWNEDGFDRMIAVNLKGVWLAMRAEIKAFLAQGAGGAIVNTGSIAGLVGLPTSSGYVAAKHGVVGLTKTAAIDYATDRIRVNAVCPGYIATDMTREVMQRRGEEILRTTPARRMGTADEIAEVVCWLLSDRAGYVTGAAYAADGGFTAG